MKKNILLALCLLALLLITIRSKYYITKGSCNIEVNNCKTLADLGIKPLKTIDVPVSCIILYKDSIIGQGYNTVWEKGNIGGHAEINAISGAISAIGSKRFNQIKDSIILVTTFEPCLMCKGAIIENGIKKVVFIKEKNFWHWLKNDLKDLQYEFNKQQCKNCGELQDSLFRLYPNYKE